MKGTVLTVSTSSDHSFTKEVQDSIRLLAGLGVEGDAHSGATVKHRSRVKRDPSQPNLRQIHLIHGELFDELTDKGFELFPGAIGENILTQGLPLLDLPTQTKLHIGETAVVEISGSRNPCWQLDEFQSGLMKAMLERDTDGRLIRKSGVMGIICEGGDVRAGDVIEAALPPKPHKPLEPV
jgi:MOSC domain-containing protein YiiM